MSGNLGANRLHGRSGGGMRAFDSLPLPLRRWMAGAALPWSAASCRRIWRAAVARGESAEAILARLDRAEARCLARMPPEGRPRRGPADRPRGKGGSKGGCQ